MERSDLHHAYLFSPSQWAQRIPAIHSPQRSIDTFRSLYASTIGSKARSKVGFGTTAVGMATLVSSMSVYWENIVLDIVLWMLRCSAVVGCWII